jgi:hypothetical protein
MPTGAKTHEAGHQNLGDLGDALARRHPVRVNGVGTGERSAAPSRKRPGQFPKQLGLLLVNIAIDKKIAFTADDPVVEWNGSKTFQARHCSTGVDLFRQVLPKCRCQ